MHHNSYQGCPCKKFKIKVFYEPDHQTVQIMSEVAVEHWMPSSFFAVTLSFPSMLSLAAVS